MRPDALKDADADAAIDRAVREMMSAEPRADFGRRVRARLERPARVVLTLPRIAAIAAVTAAVAVFILTRANAPAPPVPRVAVDAACSAAATRQDGAHACHDRGTATGERPDRAHAGSARPGRINRSRRNAGAGDRYRTAHGNRADRGLDDDAGTDFEFRNPHLTARSVADRDCPVDPATTSGL